MTEQFQMIEILRCKYPAAHKHALRAFEFELVNRVLDVSDGNRSRAAQLLGISRRHLLRIIDKWDELQTLPGDGNWEAPGI
jgi:transcriptional regulator with PAS, ATPase and Fis domain